MRGALSSCVKGMALSGIYLGCGIAVLWVVSGARGVNEDGVSIAGGHTGPAGPAGPKTSHVNHVSNTLTTCTTCPPSPERRHSPSLPALSISITLPSPRHELRSDYTCCCYHSHHYSHHSQWASSLVKSCTPSIRPWGSCLLSCATRRRRSCLGRECLASPGYVAAGWEGREGREEGGREGREIKASCAPGRLLRQGHQRRPYHQSARQARLDARQQG
jgi:hypothetical protein